MTLVGIDSVQAPMERRDQGVRAAGPGSRSTRLERMTTVVGLDEVPAVAERILTGQVRGRTVVDVNA